MSYGSPVMRQHVVEFIVGTGVVTDGVTDATSENGPWTWTVPLGVSRLELDATAPGGGGGGGAATAGNISAGGGGGGSSGPCVWGAQLPVVPNADLTITLGVGGTGGGVGGVGVNPGATTIAGTLLNHTQGVFRLNQNFAFYNGRGVNGNGSATVAGTGGLGGGSPAVASAATGVNTTAVTSSYLGGTFHASNGAGGGSGNASGSVNGSDGGQNSSTGTLGWGYHVANSGDVIATGKGVGNNAAGCSRGGGGGGGNSLFGRGGVGGNGGAAGGAAGGYGAGGGGGGADGAGGAGGDGYVRFTYWSVD